MNERVEGAMPWVIKRVALLTVITTFLAVLFSLVSGQWSTKGFTYNEIMLGGFLLAFGLLTGLKPKTQFAISGPIQGWRSTPYSGLLTIGIGIGICMMYR